MNEKAVQIHDAEQEPWKAERRPDPSPERLRYDAATIKRDEIGKRMREWGEPRCGEEYEALVGQWIRATALADKAFDALIASQIVNPAGEQL